METLQISQLPFPASRICLGTWAMGGWLWGGSDDQAAIDTILAALNGGINIIDTAPVYGFGHAEELIGKAIKLHGNRDKIIIATKAGLEWHDDKVVRNASTKRIQQEITDSLKRLQTDYIDVYQVHWPDPLVPVQETALAMKKLLDSGVIRAVGVSNFTPELMDTFLQHCPIHVSQPPYNLFERDIEKDLLPYAEKHHMITFAYGALCRGLLSGKLTAHSEFNGDDIRNLDPKFQIPRFQQYLNAVKALDNFSRKNYGKSVIALAIRWILAQGHTIALWGARKPEQLIPLNEVTGWTLKADALKQIDEIIAEHVIDPVGPGFMAPPSREKTTAY